MKYILIVTICLGSFSSIAQSAEEYLEKLSSQERISINNQINGDFIFYHLNIPELDKNSQLNNEIKDLNGEYSECILIIPKRPDSLHKKVWTYFETNDIKNQAYATKYQLDSCNRIIKLSSSIPRENVSFDDFDNITEYRFNYSNCEQYKFGSICHLNMHVSMFDKTFNKTIKSERKSYLSGENVSYNFSDTLIHIIYKDTVNLMLNEFETKLEFDQDGRLIKKEANRLSKHFLTQEKYMFEYDSLKRLEEIVEIIEHFDRVDMSNFKKHIERKEFVYNEFDFILSIEESKTNLRTNSSSFYSKSYTYTYFLGSNNELGVQVLISDSYALEKSIHKYLFNNSNNWIYKSFEGGSSIYPTIKTRILKKSL